MTTPRTSAHPLGGALDFLRIIWSLDHGLQSLSKRMQRTLGVTGPQRVALRVVGRRPGLSAGELAAVLRLHPSTLTGILQRLEDRGLMKRTNDPGDRRRARLALTPKGRALAAPSPGTIEAAVGRVLREVPGTRLRSVERLLSQVADALVEESARGRRRRERVSNV